MRHSNFCLQDSQKRRHSAYFCMSRQFLSGAAFIPRAYSPLMPGLGLPRNGNISQLRI